MQRFTRLGPDAVFAHEALQQFKVKEEAKAKPIHPLHSIDFLADMMRNTGCYPDVERCTGRTTILALKFLTEALSNPYKPVEVRDHYPTRASHSRLTYEIACMAHRLGLQHIYANEQACTVTFGKL